MIGEEEFALMVSEDIKNKADQMTKDLLRSPENRERWKKTLINIIKNVETRLEGLNKEAIVLRSTYPDFEADPAASIAKVIEKSERFKFHAEKKLAEVDRMLFLENDDPDSKLSSFLKDAILMHKKLKLQYKRPVDPADIGLWDAVDGKWTF
tara:strand:- start:749 stop:1204 length:456 start_codon:yes stop_codon:yes gene_type:complete